ncbi:MAG: transporter substrate-binding domain-containing protein, partial [Paracoccus sp. (in: a-proteobacteria)]|nr:transporter substrate-binding domain-containing protein [Paracoccus sp. (in: a-proteobacteria)]
SAISLIHESPLPLALAGEPFSEIRNAWPFRDDEEGRALRDRVNTALEELREDGTLAEISDKWFGDDITVPDTDDAQAD